MTLTDIVNKGADLGIIFIGSLYGDPIENFEGEKPIYVEQMQKNYESQGAKERMSVKNEYDAVRKI